MQKTQATQLNIDAHDLKERFLLLFLLALQLENIWNGLVFLSRRIEATQIARLSFYKLGLIKRSECYLHDVIKTHGREYCLYMVSIGDRRKNRCFFNINPLAKALNRVMFDHVFVIVEKKSVVIITLHRLKLKLKNEYETSIKKGERKMPFRCWIQ